MGRLSAVRVECEFQTMDRTLPRTQATGLDRLPTVPGGAGADYASAFPGVQCPISLGSIIAERPVVHATANQRGVFWPEAAGPLWIVRGVAANILWGMEEGLSVSSRIFGRTFSKIYLK